MSWLCLLKCTMRDASAPPTAAKEAMYETKSQARRAVALPSSKTDEAARSSLCTAFTMRSDMEAPMPGIQNTNAVCESRR